MRQVRQFMIVVGIAGVAVGIYDAQSGNIIGGAVIGVISIAAGTLAWFRLRSERRA